MFLAAGSTLALVIEAVEVGRKQDVVICYIFVYRNKDLVCM